MYKIEYGKVGEIEEIILLIRGKALERKTLIEKWERIKKDADCVETKEKADLMNIIEEKTQNLERELLSQDMLEKTALKLEKELSRQKKRHLIRSEAEVDALLELDEETLRLIKAKIKPLKECQTIYVSEEDKKVIDSTGHYIYMDMHIINHGLGSLI